MTLNLGDKVLTWNGLSGTIFEIYKDTYIVICDDSMEVCSYKADELELNHKYYDGLAKKKERRHNHGGRR